MRGSSDRRQGGRKTRGEERRLVNFKTFIKQEGRKVPVIKILYWLVLAGKQQSNMCDLGQEISGT